MADNARGGVHYGDKVPRPPSRGFEPGARGTERRPEAPKPDGSGFFAGTAKIRSPRAEAPEGGAKFRGRRAKTRGAGRPRHFEP